jgi:hypothetical protein
MWCLLFFHPVVVGILTASGCVLYPRAVDLQEEDAELNMGFFSALTLALVLLAGNARAQATVVKDDLCGLFDAEGGIQLGAFGLSTLAPNGVVHLVCTAIVPAPGLRIVFGPSRTPACWIEDRFATEWVERISPSGQAVLDCWVDPSAGR